MQLQADVLQQVLLKSYKNFESLSEWNDTIIEGNETMSNSKQLLFLVAQWETIEKNTYP